MSRNMLEGPKQFPEGIHQPIGGYFEDLKNLITPGVDLERFSSLIHPDDRKDLKEKVNNRYLDIFNLIARSRIPIEQGVVIDGKIYMIPSVTEDMIIAILDDNTFEKLSEEIKFRGSNLATTTREVARAEVAKSLGWNIFYTSVYPRSSFLGLSVFLPSPQENPAEWALRSAASNFGPKIVTEKLGLEASGLETDMEAIKAKAKIALDNPNRQFASTGAFLTNAESLAGDILNSFGIERISKEADDITKKKLSSSRF